MLNSGLITRPSLCAGKGNHSVGGRARIRPAVVRWLTEAGHRFTSTPDTGGIIVQVLFTLRHQLARLARCSQACFLHPGPSFTLQVCGSGCFKYKTMCCCSWVGWRQGRGALGGFKS